MKCDLCSEPIADVENFDDGYANGTINNAGAYHVCKGCFLKIEDLDTNDIENALRAKGWPSTDDIVAICDPDIKYVVRWLLEKGFETTDSGDGHTKLEAGWDERWLIPHPHVIIQVDGDLMAESIRLLNELRGADVKVIQVGECDGDGSPLDGCWIQATYDPVTDRGFIELAHLDDDTLRKALGAEVLPDERSMRDIALDTAHGVGARVDDVTIKLPDGQGGVRVITMARKTVQAMQDYEKSQPGGLAGVIEANSMKVMPLTVGQEVQCRLAACQPSPDGPEFLQVAFEGEGEGEDEAKTGFQVEDDDVVRDADGSRYLRCQITHIDGDLVLVRFKTHLRRVDGVIVQVPRKWIRT